MQTEQHSTLITKWDSIGFLQGISSLEEKQALCARYEEAQELMYLNNKALNGFNKEMLFVLIPALYLVHQAKIDKEVRWIAKDLSGWIAKLPSSTTSDLCGDDLVLSHEILEKYISDLKSRVSS